MNTPRLLAVVLHYGDTAMTRAVYEALACKAAPHEALVLDNAAPQPYPGALRLPENVFWGGALAYSLNLARERGADYLWFCNNDITFLQPHTGAALLPFVAGRLARIGKQCGKLVGVWAPALTSSPYHPQMRHAQGVDYRRTAYVDGVAFALNLACVDAIGGPDVGENPRGYGVDVWLSLRAHAAGWPVVADQQVVIRHRHHSTAKQIDGFMDAAARDEDAYMTARLGRDWRASVQEQSGVWEDVG